MSTGNLSTKQASVNTIYPNGESTTNRLPLASLFQIGEIEEESSGGGVIEEGDEREEEEEDDSCNGSRPGAEAWQGDGSTAEPTEAEQGQGHGKNGGEGEEREEGEDHEESDSVMDFKVGPLSREDAEVVASAKGLLEVAVKTLTTIARPLITGV